MSNAKKDAHEEVSCACSALRQATRIVSRHYESHLARTGATTTQYSILRYLQRNGESPLRTIADSLELERTSLYRAIGPLERDGFVILRVDPSDARVKLADLTPNGVARIDEIRPHWQRAQDSFMAAVGDVTWMGLADGLDDLRQSVAADPGFRGQLRPSFPSSRVPRP